MINRVVVPVKAFAEAKTRLSPVLTARQREQLARAFATDTLALLAAHPEVSSITVVSDDPQVLEVAADYGADSFHERRGPGLGLNAALEACLFTLQDAVAQSLIVLHADLPCLTCDDLSAVIALRRRAGGVVLGCDRRGSGTNLLAFSSIEHMPMAFGRDSCARFQRQADARGLQCSVMLRAGIGHDVDAPEDLRALQARRGDRVIGAATSRLLAAWAPEDAAPGDALAMMEPCRGVVD
ncbi:2-phospho-L-lactate guanylyltransferase [Pseudohaliea sp.]|uniref:2-phospho-L-lactate guanylyltransferase n=1 Tax=Pseudohaliea sp. TaxID=2740289 RepID=UPI0032EC31E4